MRRLRPADLGAGAAGVALLVVLFLPWYGVSRHAPPAAISFFTDHPPRTTGHWIVLGGERIYAGPGDPTAWQAFSVVDILLAVAAVVAAVIVVVTATTRGPAKPVASTVIATVASAIAVLLVLWRLIDPPEDIFTRHYGVWLGLAATLLMLGTSWAALHDERTPGAVAPDIPRRPAPGAA